MDEKEMWVRFAVAAVESYERPDDVDSVDEVADDVGELVGKIADALVAEYKDRFGSGRRRPARGEKDE